MSEIAENLRRVKERMAQAAISCGRLPEAISLLAISKTSPAADIAQAVEAGQLRFGESRVQEAEAKIRSLSGMSGIEWHLVGHLQSNKARLAAGLFDWIHSVDSIRLAAKLNEACLALGKRLSVLIQVDLGQEETKFGLGAGEIHEALEAISHLDGLRLQGLMTIPPFFEDAERATPYFVKLRRLGEALESAAPGCLGRRELSMGMSHDFEIAIREGATIIRVGTAIFGERFRG
jgi:pyridoxal phosphate enzyme (YggS family)